MKSSGSPHRQLPSVNELVEEVRAETPDVPRPVIVDVARSVLDEARRHIDDGRTVMSPETLRQQLRLALIDALGRERRPSLDVVINATGILIHTGLGRAPLARSAAEAMARAAAHYTPVELDLARGERGRRVDHVRDRLCRVTGAEAATVVNNNAAALMLALAAVARQREVIVSRGELIEIGGSFRLPDVMAAGGAQLREVGTTNRTRLGDYERAIGPETGAILKVHTSNYRVVGFASSVPIDELAALGRYHEVPVIDDIGSGALVSAAGLGLPDDEPTARASIEAGADLVLFSGDKLLGGPQAGIIVGGRELVACLDAHPMMRALRVDKTTLAGLEETLRLHHDPETARANIPVMAMTQVPVATLERRGRELLERLGACAADCRLTGSEAQLGGGSLPTTVIPSCAVVVTGGGLDEETLATRLRTGAPHVLPRVHDGAVWIDLRTVFPEQDEALARALQAALTMPVVDDTSSA